MYAGLTFDIPIFVSFAVYLIWRFCGRHTALNGCEAIGVLVRRHPLAKARLSMVFNLSLIGNFVDDC